MNALDLPALHRAAEAGDAEASAHLAAFAGMGAGMAQSWPQALSFLADAAEQGLSAAHDQLRLLAQGPDAATPILGGEAARALADRVDVAAWLTSPSREALCETPRIRVLRNFVSPATCRWLMARGQGRMGEALVYDPDIGAGRAAAARSNSAFELGLFDLDLVVVMLRARIAAAVRVPLGAMEPPQLLHYAVGQGFKRHYDFSDPEQPGYGRQIAERGQRIATLLVYLNDGYKGGETDFPRAGVRFKGQAGDALMFANVDLAGAPDRLTLHEGLPPTAGEKWLFSQWVRDRALGG